MIWDKNCAKAYAQNMKSNKKIIVEATLTISDENCVNVNRNSTDGNRNCMNGSRSREDKEDRQRG